MLFTFSGLGSCSKSQFMRFSAVIFSGPTLKSGFGLSIRTRQDLLKGGSTEISLKLKFMMAS